MNDLHTTEIEGLTQFWSGPSRDVSGDDFVGDCWREGGAWTVSVVCDLPTREAALRVLRYAARLAERGER